MRQLTETGYASSQKSQNGENKDDAVTKSKRVINRKKRTPKGQLPSRSRTHFRDGIPKGRRHDQGKFSTENRTQTALLYLASLLQHFW